MGHCRRDRIVATGFLMASILLGPSLARADGPWKGYGAAFTFTSDDGNKDNVDWTAEFVSRGMSYTAFVVPTQLNTTILKMTDADLRYLHESGIEIGSHSMTHIILTGNDDATVINEMVGSCRALENVLQDPNYHCRTFAYPQHAHDLHVMAIAESLGFTGARDGGYNPIGYPYQSLGKNVWTETSLFEVPIVVGVEYLVAGNSYSEEVTKAKVDTLVALGVWKNVWINIYAHRYFEVDATHMGWILDELAQSDVWVDNFGAVADYYRSRHQMNIPAGVIPPADPSVAPPASGHELRYLLGGDAGGEDPPAPEISPDMMKSVFGSQITALVPPVFTPPFAPTLVPVENAMARVPILRLPSPNPARGNRARLRFSLPRSAQVRLRVLDLSGREVRLLVNEVLDAGDHEVFWDGLNDGGHPAPAGVFLYHLQTPGFEQTRKILWLP